MVTHSFSIATLRTTTSGPDANSAAARMRPRRCPNCGGDLMRIRRYPIDRLLSLVIPLRRLRCAECMWEGLFRRATLGPEGAPDSIQPRLV